MSIPQNEERKLKRVIKDDARDRVFKDIRKMFEEMLPPLGEEDEAAKKDRAVWFDGVRTLVDTYAAVETTPLTKERMREAWARMKKNG
jgi:hypothetical protein